jgi:hypothetical protein
MLKKIHVTVKCRLPNGKDHTIGYGFVTGKLNLIDNVILNYQSAENLYEQECVYEYGRMPDRFSKVDTPGWRVEMFRKKYAI